MSASTTPPEVGAGVGAGTGATVVVRSGAVAPGTEVLPTGSVDVVLAGTPPVGTVDLSTSVASVCDIVDSVAGVEVVGRVGALVSNSIQMRS